MTRKRKTHRSQMPNDLAERERVARIDADRKARHTNPELQARMRENQTVELARNPRTHDLDIITQGNRQPRTWDEINSVTGAGGISTLYKP